MKKTIILYIFLLSFLSSFALLKAGCIFPEMTSRLWNNVENDLIVDISVLSKVCTIESIIDNIELHISNFNSSLNTKLVTITSYVEIIDAEIISIESTTDDLGSFITGPFESKINLIEKVDASILSLVNVVETRTNSIYSIDQNIASFIDLGIETDQSIFSKIMVIDSAISNLNFACSGVDEILQTEQSILSIINVIDTRTGSIYNVDQNINSYAQNIDQQVTTIQSTVNTINSFVDNTINSKLDLIIATDQSIGSLVSVIDTRTSSIYNIDQTILSKLSNYTVLAASVQSAINIIDSKVGNLNCITSLTSQLDSLDQSILSTVMLLDTRTNLIQANTNNIFSLDQTISSNLSTILNVQQSTSSKVDDSIVLDVTIASLLNNINSTINSLASCSSIIQLLQINQSILSTVNVIDTRTSNIQSDVSNIYTIDQSISSKIDVDTRIDDATQSTVSIINSKANIISSSIASTSSITNENKSILDALSTCCTGTTNSNTVFNSLYNSLIADYSNDNINISFQYGIPNTIMNTYTQGGATVTNQNSMAILTSGSTSSIAELQTKNVITYRSGHEAYAYFSVAFTGSFAATSSQFIGPIDYQNGFAIGFDGPTFGVTRRSNTINTFTPQSQFNGDKLDGTGTSQFTYNPAALNLFRIAYGYLGGSIVKFQILTAYNNWVTFHTINYPNTSATPLILQPFLPVTARVENLSGTSILKLQTASWKAGIVAEPNSNSYRYFQFNSAVTTASTAETHVFTLQNPLIFNNQPNKIIVRLTGIGGGIINGDYTVIKNATVSGTSFVDVSAGDSVLKVSTAGTFSVGTGTDLFVYATLTLSLGFGPFFFTNNPFSILLFPGETLTLTTQGSASSQTGLLMWEEQF